MIADHRQPGDRENAGRENDAATKADATSDADSQPLASSGQEVADSSLDTAGLERIVKLTASIVAPVTVLTALLFYFGFARTNALYSWFGIDASTLGFSTQDYLVRSVEAVYVPAGTLILVILFLLWAHGVVSLRIGDRPRRSWVLVQVFILGFIGLLLFGRGIAGILLPSLSNNDFLITPLCLGLGTLFVAYALHLQRRLRKPHRNLASDQADLLRGVNSALVILLVLLSIFWMTANYAKAYGRGFASQLSQRLDRQPAVAIYSTDRLYLHGTGVVEHRLSSTAGVYHYKYTGLRLLIQSRGRYFLLPEDWARESDAAIVLPDNDRLRFEFMSGSN
jgi:uncharacterized membrane protein YbaN (DUF454 family)